MLVIYLVLLFGLPAGLVISPLGAAGSPASVFGIMCLILWLAARFDPRWAPQRRVAPAKWVMYALAIVTVTSYVLAVLRGVPSEQQSGADRALLSLFSWLGVALTAVDFLRTREDVERILRLFLFATTGLAVIGLLQFTTGLDVAALYHIPGLSQNTAIAQITERSNFARVQGTASHAIEFGVVLGTAFPFALHYAFYDQFHRTRWLFITGLLIVGAAVSISRSAVICLVVSTVVMFSVWSGSRRLATLLFAPVILVALRMMVPGLVGTMVSLFSAGSSDPSVQGRLDDYAAVRVLVAHHPLIGRGVGTFLPEDFFFLDNQYLGTLIELGFLGLMCVAVMFIIGMGLGRGVRLRAQDEAGAHLGQTFVAAFASLILAFGTFDALAFPMITGVFFLLFGMVNALWRIGIDESGFTARGPRWRAVPSSRYSGSPTNP